MFICFKFIFFITSFSFCFASFKITNFSEKPLEVDVKANFKLIDGTNCFKIKRFTVEGTLNFSSEDFIEETLDKKPELLFLTVNCYRFSIDELFCKGFFETTEFKIESAKKLSTVIEQIKQCFEFARKNISPNPEVEAKKDPRLKNPSEVIRGLYNKTASDSLEGIEYLEQETLTVLEKLSSCEISSAKEVRIPKVSHRIWLTDLSNPKQPPIEHIERYIQSVVRLGRDWKHKFWCWNRASVSSVVERLENFGVEVVEVSNLDLLNRMPAKQMFFAAIDHGLYTLAGNILRNMILFDEGGFYGDMGGRVVYDLLNLHKESDVIAHFRKGRTDKTAWWIDHDFMASVPKNPISGEFLRRIDKLSELQNDAKIVNFFNNPRMMHCLTNARLLTEIFTLFSKEQNLKVLLLPDADSFIESHHLTSWYGGDDKSCRDIDKTTLNWFRVSENYLAERDSLLRSGFSFELYKKFIAPDVVTEGEAVHHFLENAKRFDAKQTVTSVPVVVSLTSWKGKIHNAYLAVRSMLIEESPLNDIVLWLAEEEFLDRQGVPDTLTALERRGLLKIRWHKRNIRSGKKLVPPLMDDELRPKILVTADDDIAYKANWLQELVKEHLNNPHAIIAHRMRQVNFDEFGKLKPYNSWRLLKSKESITDGTLLFPTSGGGVLFPSNSLDDRVLDEDLFMELCPTGDDIFWWIMALLKGSVILPAANMHYEITETNGAEESAVSLWATNSLGANDVMLRKILEHFSAVEVTDKRLQRLLRGI